MFEKAVGDAKDEIIRVSGEIKPQLRKNGNLSRRQKIREIVRSGYL